MSTAYVVVTVVTILANAGAVIADLAKADFVLENSDEVGVSRRWLPLLATLKAAGAVGLLLGLFDITVIGAAAAVGLVVFFVGAIIAHVRARVFHNIAFPGFYLALAIASLTLSVTR